MAVACAGPFREERMLAEVRSAAPYSGLDEATFGRVLSFIESGGYALRAYDRFKRLTREPDGTWRVSHPRFIQQHRMNAGIIVDQPMLDVRFWTDSLRLCAVTTVYSTPTLLPAA